ncbi:MAG: hypothetical protein ACP6IY_09590 [Promethearchaeia archaeon]
MKPVLIRINKKTVESSPNLKYAYRIAFRFKKKIPYFESEYLFRDIGDRNVGLGIVTDSQFAKWLVDNLGLGRYLVFLWRKGYEGFSVYYFDCEVPNKWRMIKKRKSKDRENKEKEIRTLRRYERESKKVKNEEEKEELKDKISSLRDDIGFSDEIIKLEDGMNARKIKLFQITKPAYKYHEYEDYGQTKEEGGITNTKYDTRIW